MREHLIDPVIFRGNPVAWRNYEASYDVSELEPSSRARDTYVLQEYFVPVDSIGAFLPRMRRVLQEHDVNAVNVSIRHALPDPGTYLAWAPNEVFAFVLYYKQAHRPRVAARGGALDPRADRRGGRERRTLLPALPARRDAGTVHGGVPALVRAVRGEAARRSDGQVHQRAVGSVPPCPRRHDAGDDGAASRGEPSRRGAHRARQREGLLAEGSERVPDASRVGSRVRQRGVRELAGAGEAAEWIPVRRVRRDVLAVVRRHLRRRQGSVRRRHGHSRHAQRDRREHGDRVRAQGTLREHVGPADRVEHAGRRHGRGQVRGEGGARLREAHRHEGLVRVRLHGRVQGTLERRAAHRAGLPAQVGASVRAERGVSGEGGVRVAHRRGDGGGLRAGRAHAARGGGRMERAAGRVDRWQRALQESARSRSRLLAALGRPVRSVPRRAARAVGPRRLRADRRDQRIGGGDDRRHRAGSVAHAGAHVRGRGVPPARRSGADADAAARAGARPARRAARYSHGAGSSAWSTFTTTEWAGWLVRWLAGNAVNQSAS